MGDVFFGNFENTTRKIDIYRSPHQIVHCRGIFGPRYSVVRMLWVCVRVLSVAIDSENLQPPLFVTSGVNLISFLY